MNKKGHRRIPAMREGVVAHTVARTTASRREDKGGGETKEKHANIQLLYTAVRLGIALS